MQINSEVYILIGEILQARNSKLFISNQHKIKFKNAEKELDLARKDLSAFGMYDDCGSSYESDYELAKGKFEESKNNLSLVISFEKNYKKLKHEFMEKYPEYEFLLNEYLNNQTKLIEKKYRGK